MWKFRAGLEGSCSPVQALPALCRLLLLVQTHGCDFQLLREATTKPQMSSVWHWLCLNCDPFAFQVSAQQIRAKGKRRVINREVVVLHCGTVGTQLCHPAPPGQGKGLGKVAQTAWGQPAPPAQPHAAPLGCFPCPLHIPQFYWGRKLGQELGAPHCSKAASPRF